MPEPITTAIAAFVKETVEIASEVTSELSKNVSEIIKEAVEKTIENGNEVNNSLIEKSDNQILKDKDFCEKLRSKNYESRELSINHEGNVGEKLAKKENTLNGRENLNAINDKKYTGPNNEKRIADNIVSTPAGSKVIEWKNGALKETIFEKDIKRTMQEIKNGPHALEKFAKNERGQLEAFIQRAYKDKELVIPRDTALNPEMQKHLHYLSERGIRITTMVSKSFQKSNSFI